VLFSHGFGGFPEYDAGHLSHLASWGFVVAAPDHTSRDLAAVATGTVGAGDDDVVDLRETLELLRTEAAEGGRFAGAVDFDRIAAEGHSAGGGAAAELLDDPEIDTFIGQAPVPPFVLRSSEEVDQAALSAGYADTAPPQKPSMIVTGDRDGIVEVAGVDTLYAWLAPPKRYAVLANAGHNAFLDICEPIRAQGGLSQFLDTFPPAAVLVRLGEDGCTDGYADPAATYRVVDHLTVAQLRWVFGLDPSDASLTAEYLDALFPGALARYEFEGSPESGQG
jgi:dienelactone hydrolase